MLRRIILENFMSHGRTVIDLAEGLTVLTGPNNCGKSAVVAALQVLASNGRTTHVMRHGCKNCRVAVETDDGHTIVWERTKSSAKYIINGEPIHRVGQGIPEHLHDILRLECVEAEAGKSKYEYDIHFGEQKSPIFLLGETGSRAASFFASSSDASRLIEMQHLHRSKVRDRKAEAKRITAELEQTDFKLDRFSGVDEVDERIATAEQRYEQLQKLKERIRDIRRLTGQLHQLRLRVERHGRELRVLHKLDGLTTNPEQLTQSQRNATNLRSIAERLHVQINNAHCWKTRCSVLGRLIPPPQQHDIDAVRGRLKELSSMILLKNQASRVCVSCKPLLPPPEMNPTRDAQRLLTKIRNMEEAVLVKKRQRDRLQPLQPPPALTPPDALANCVTQLTRAEQRRKQALERQTALNPLQPPPAEVDPDALKQTLAALHRSAEQLQQIQATSGAADQSLNSCEDEIRQFVRQNPRCSVCGSKIDPTQVLSSAPTSHNHADEGESR